MTDTKKLFVAEGDHTKVKVKIENEEFEFELRKLTYMERNRILGDCMSFHGTQVDLNYAELIKKVLLTCLVKAPFEINEANIEQLSDEVGTQLESYLPILKTFR